MTGQGVTWAVSELNHVLLRERREGRGWSRRRSALELQRESMRLGLPAMPQLESIERSIARHERGSVTPDALYIRLYRSVYGLSEQAITGSLAPSDPADEISITSHKFVMAMVPKMRLQNTRRSAFAADPWFESEVEEVKSEYGQAALYVWPFGVACLHLVENVTVGHLADLSCWRLHTYERDLDWFSGYLSDRCGHGVMARYVLSSYWVNGSPWPGAEAETASHLLSVPKTLMSTVAESRSAEMESGRLLERNLFREHFRHPHVVDFGVSGISFGAASWSGVAYVPVAPERSLSERDLVTCELSVQALWCYADSISQSLERGDYPDLDSEYSWRFLARARSRLAMARPQESGQHAAMRNAIVKTSGVVELIDNAIELLKGYE